MKQRTGPLSPAATPRLELCPKEMQRGYVDLGRACPRRPASSAGPCSRFVGPDVAPTLGRRQARRTPMTSRPYEVMVAVAADGLQSCGVLCEHVQAEGFDADAMGVGVASLKFRYKQEDR
jgi:hypothetical protein